MSTKTLQIGITGGIGSGKSTVCKVFSLLGIPIYNADDRAKWLMSYDVHLIQQLKENFGEETYSSNGELNRSYLAQQVFNDSNRVHTLNQLVHPCVAKDYLAWVKENKNKTSYLIKEAALLYESGSYKGLDKVINVYAPIELRIQRVQQRDSHRTEKEIRSIIEKQLSEEERSKKADYVIYNDEQQFILSQVLELHHTFSKS